MEEADQILVQELAALGFKFGSLGEINSDSFVICIGYILATLYNKMPKEENFLDKEKIQAATRYTEVQNKYALCQTLVNYIKKLGYYYDITFNVLFNPSVSNIRKVLSFLFDSVAKTEETGKPEDAAQEANLDFMIKRRIQKWTKKVWLVPEFLLLPKPKLVERGKVIRVLEERDRETVEASKAKKLKQVSEFLEGMKMDEVRYVRGREAMGEMMNGRNEWRKVWDKKKE